MSNSKKIVFAGDSGVGKTSIIKRFVDGVYDMTGSVPTINVNFSSRDVKVGDQTIKLQLWDTAGQEAYRSISKSYFRNAKCIILVYDIQNRSSFQNLEEWVNLIEDGDSKSTPWVLFGNKNDLPEYSVSEEEAMQFCEDHDVQGYRGSAKSGVCIEECFYEVAELILKSETESKTEDIINPSAPLKPVEKPKEEGCC